MASNLSKMLQSVSIWTKHLIFPKTGKVNVITDLYMKKYWLADVVLFYKRFIHFIVEYKDMQWALRLNLEMSREDCQF